MVIHTTLVNQTTNSEYCLVVQPQSTAIGVAEESAALDDKHSQAFNN